MVIDHPNRLCDCQKALLNSHCDHQFLDVTANSTNLNSLLFLKQFFPYFKIANQIYEGSIAQAVRNMEMVSNNLTS